MVRYKHMQHKNGQGFTIVELLIVIVVIGILAAITLVAYAGLQARARDNVRAQDFATLQKMIKLYETTNGSSPIVSTYGGTGGGGWNTSNLSAWLTPLSSVGTVPKDPVNDFTGDPGNMTAGANAGYGYFYFCYDANPDFITLGYFKESGGRQRVTTQINTTCA